MASFSTENNNLKHNNKRIAKNTAMLYFRMLFTMAITLYTSRVVLNTLGVEDFGIYNVVGGVVVILGFLNNAMATATQRFLSYEIGRGDKEHLKQIFSHSLTLHIFIAFIIVFLAETIGLWFLNTQMNIPAGRMNAAQWVYQFSILTFVISIIQVPYNASIIAHERMGIYAYVSIFEVSLKLVIVLMLVWIGLDKLKLYAILIFAVSIIIAAIYRMYCKSKFSECHFKLSWKKSLFYSLLSFSGWNVFGNMAWVAMGQGLNILLNMFFGPTLNAAYAISFQVNSAIMTFVANFRTAVNPQIVKSCAEDDMEYMNKLVFISTKYSYYLILSLSLVVLLETNFVLKLWLKTLPDNAVLFCQLILINSLIQVFGTSFDILFQALGRIKENQLMYGITYILIIPLTYLLLKNNFPPRTVFYVQIAGTVFISFIVKLYFLVKIAGIKSTYYFKQLIAPTAKVTLVAIVLPLLIKNSMDDGWLRFLTVFIVSIASIAFSVLYFGISENERKFAFNYLKITTQKIF